MWDITASLNILKAQVHSKNNLLSIELEKSGKPIKKSLSKIGWLKRKLWIFNDMIFF